VSNPDSFIDEVTEEVRRDQLFAMFRKYGWIGAVAVVAIVGGTAYNEWSKAQATARAQSFGDALEAALVLPTPAERAAALASVAGDGAQVAPKALLTAAQSDKVTALADLRALVADASQPQLYRDLASLRAVMLAGADQPLADRRAALQDLAVPGRAFRTLASEQLAYLLVEEGKTEAAIKALGDLMQDQDAPSSLRTRAAQMITALGGTPPEAKAAAAG
jgi:hypothetical protein